MGDAGEGSPMGALARNWFTKVKYMYEVRMANATGGVMITKLALNRLPDKHQKAIREVSKNYLEKLVKKVQEDNNLAITLMKQNGLKVTPLPDADELEKFYAVGREVQAKMKGKLFSQSLLDQVESHLKALR